MQSVYNETGKQFIEEVKNKESNKKVKMRINKQSGGKVKKKKKKKKKEGSKPKHKKTEREFVFFFFDAVPNNILLLWFNDIILSRIKNEQKCLTVRWGNQ